jgi:hypothetical protein
MARRRFQYDADDVPSLEVRIRAQGGPAVDLSGTVDSGASTTVLSIEDAKELGLNPEDLRSAPDAIVANKTRVHCWTAPTPIRAQVLRPTASGDELVPWGPVFAVDVMFMQDADPLWGQADFFATFAINFERPEFTLRY